MGYNVSNTGERWWEGRGRAGLVVKGGLVGGWLQASLDINMYTIKIIYYVQHLQTDQ